ncbi:phosphotransferase enzyme family protein [Capillimicrobium parvum]|uniref:Stress response kinase A n=1 Tax=Capillimicrobium parvum TaxID=2884022 RepID=A0A9E6Y0N0_9ACTN|nr:phosphotransferase [Capillimicrobium parvum]UGS37447.1 Stress response kinase A [Capillimicrobium parvum]
MADDVLTGAGADLDARAVAAAVAISREHGIRVREPRVLGATSNVLVHLRPAPVVARVATTTATVRPRAGALALEREIAVAEHLAATGAAVVAPSRELPPGPHRHDGLALSFWTHVEHDGAAPEMTEVGRSLAELHERLRSFPGRLSYLEPCVAEVGRAIGVLERDHALDPRDIAELREAAAHVERALAPLRDAAQPVHGDAHPGNVIVTRDGLLWTDFEDTCAAPRAWDLACLAASSRFAAEPALAGYAEALGADPAGDGELEPFVTARMLQGTVFLAVLARRFPERRRQAEQYRRALRDRF